jgi:hypothetical protein
VPDSFSVHCAGAQVRVSYVPGTVPVGLVDKYAEIRSGNHGEEVIALSQVL